MMRKILILLGFIVTAVLVEGVAYYLTSNRSVEENAAVVAELPPEPTTFDEMMDQVAECRDKRHFAGAYGYARLALDHAKKTEQRVAAGYVMGQLLYEDYRHGGASEIEAAVLYLQAAFAQAQDPEVKQEIGNVLLDALGYLNDPEVFMKHLESMIADALDPDQRIMLWHRKFNYLLRQENGWHEMNAALAAAENMPHQDEAWYALLKDMRVRTHEKLLTDEKWFRPYVETLGYDDPAIVHQKLFDAVRKALGQIYKDSGWKDQAEVLLRLAKAYVAVENYEKGYEYLTMFLDMEPTEKLSDALVLHSRIARVRGGMASVAELAKSMIRRFNFDRYTRDEVFNIVQVLEESGLYDDALDLLDGAFSAVETPGREMAPLIRRAAVIEERQGHRANALNYMNQLKELQADAEFDKAYTELINLNMQKSDYSAVENLVYLFQREILPESEDYKNGLFCLFDAKFWLDRPIIEQLYVGSAAIQKAPEDPRTASVELRMAGYIENMNLNDLAISYYNRIGLLNFFQDESDGVATSHNIGEQAMLGKARCLMRLEDWAGADHLYRELCNRTKSPLVKAEAAVAWGELALRFSQRKEADRRFNLAYAQLLSETDQVRYMLGRSQLEGAAEQRTMDQVDESIQLLEKLPESKRKAATIAFFNDTFDHFYDRKNEVAMLRVVDLACQNELADWLPIQSYLLRLYEKRFDHENIVGLGNVLREKDDVAGASIVELAQVTDRVEQLGDWVDGYKRKAIK